MSNLFNYAIGFRWDEKDINSSVGLYSYGSNHWHGDITAALETLEFIQARAKGDGTVYRIYRLEEL